MLLKVADVARRLNCSQSTVYQLTESGRLAAFHIGARQGGIRVSEEQLTEYLQSSLAEANPRPPPAERQLKHIRLS